MKSISLLLFALLFCTQSSHAAEDNTSYPFRPEPRHSVDKMSMPGRGVRLALADALHDAQVTELEAVEASSNSGDSLSCLSEFMIGITMALEEYYQRELSYPDSVNQLHSSGYLEPGWSNLGMVIVDFSKELLPVENTLLVYLPQPVGSVDIIRIPGHGCGTTMLSYYEYSLLIPSSLSEEWEIDPEKNTENWIKPYLKYGYSEVFHINQKEPATTRCPKC